MHHAPINWGSLAIIAPRKAAAPHRFFKTYSFICRNTHAGSQCGFKKIVDGSQKLSFATKVAPKILGKRQNTGSCQSCLRKLTKLSEEADKVVWGSCQLEFDLFRQSSRIFQPPLSLIYDETNFWVYTNGPYHVTLSQHIMTWRSRPRRKSSIFPMRYIFEKFKTKSRSLVSFCDAMVSVQCATVCAMKHLLSRT